MLFFQVEYLADGTSSKKKQLNQKFIHEKDKIQKEGIACQIPGPVKDSSDRMKKAISKLVHVSVSYKPSYVQIWAIAEFTRNR